MKPAFAVSLLALLLGACGGRYGEFTLPPAEGGGAARSFRFEQAPTPVLTRGQTGEWDSVDALNPAVVKHEGTYYNCYSGYDGAVWRTGLATSSDGVAWRKHGKVLSPGPATWEGNYIAANGSLLVSGGEFLYWYQSGPKGAPRIGLARSPDCRNWRKQPAPVLETGPRGSWDERAVGDPYVIRRGGDYFLFYLGQDRAGRQRLGVARSRDGLKWVKLRSNPVLELGESGSFDENGLGEPAVWTARGFHWMLYTGRNRDEDRRLGLARSRDGVEWKKLPFVFAGTSEWSRRVLCDPEVEWRGGLLRVWFGGGDRPSPDENLNGQIGVASLAMLP